ncbi:hypothetical protein FHS31_002613 [Sphingomonas vulcanisoli]|uniref:Flagellar protein FlgN n=1 Tax=Sphingomonas vulcanisoli TaxID=1658060 RepID=A0ABX0TTZ6_9SPHN|nr:hypothetical protein [Sphingomonas vulcanisoli]NIJ08983.1 hypothetical protein [Sphingomonas vulcanisoli]
MSAAALDTLIAREEALIAALDGQDVTQIESSTDAMRAALIELAAIGAWHNRVEVGERVIQAVKLAEAAKGRINFLADRNRRKLDRLATLTGAPLAPAYGRSGRLS